MLRTFYGFYKLKTMKDNILNTVFNINCDKVVWSVLPDEVLITDKITNEIFGLKEIAFDIWLNLEKMIPLNIILDNLSKIYQVDYSILKNDLIDFVSGLLEMELIIII